MDIKDMKLGGKYIFVTSTTEAPQVLIYVGRTWSFNNNWNQFEFETDPGTVQCELLDRHLSMILEVKQ